MEYSIRELSELAGVSARTLRYYDEIGLLKPSRTSDAGYRFYGEKEVELMQQILFYRERGLELEQIAQIFRNPDEAHWKNTFWNWSSANARRSG